MTDTIDPLAPSSIEEAVPRDRYGRPKILQPDGTLEPYTRCTTFVKALEGDASALALWKQRMTALGLNARPDLMMGVATAGDGTTPESKQALNKLVEAATEAAAASSAATIGTALHKFTERLDKGEPLGNVPAAFLKDLEAYRAATAGLEMVQAEQFGVHDGLRVAGTWDRLNRHGSGYYIGDVKTGRVDDLSIGKIAMQLAIYSRCRLYDPATGERREQAVPVDTERAIVIELPAGSGECRLWWLDIAAGWQAVQLAARARKWQKWAKMKTLTEPFTMADVAQLAAPAAAPIRIPDGVDPGQNGHGPAFIQPGQPLPADDAAARALQQQQVAAVTRGEPSAAISAALLATINEAETVEALGQLWQATGASWTDEHRAAASARKAMLGG